MSRRHTPIATLSAVLLLSGCAAAPESGDADRQAFAARQRIKLEDLAYCTATALERDESAADEAILRDAVDRCMIGLGYARVATPSR